MYTLIGDIVGSSRLDDWPAAQAAIDAALGRVSAHVDVVQRLEPTMGDEVQGGFATIGDAALATLLIRLELLPRIDIRFGLGFGETSVVDADRRPILQNGPGWKAARTAIDALDDARRTGYVGPDSEEVNAFLVVRDALVDRLSAQHRRMLLHSLHGLSQREIAQVEQRTESAVSQAFRRGIRAVRDAQLILRKA
ncbi:SatD family protein [Puerhibacterium puerhi]|uniref:SatD family protein n=1 Tax=Puerhibacterium puerhi TaxID=2692623 RepID=UPI0013591142|nr:SatD family protein [Puerhibacterium puerhi]